MDSRRDFTSKKVFSGYFSELGEKANSALTKREQRTNNARTAYEQRANYARTAYASSYEQRANYERELTRELRDAPLWIDVDIDI